MRTLSSYFKEAEKHRLKPGSSRYIQKSGTIRVSDARQQVAERDAEEWLQYENRDVVNMAEARAKRKDILDKEKKVRAEAREKDKVQRNSSTKANQQK